MKTYSKRSFTHQICITKPTLVIQNVHRSDWTNGRLTTKWQRLPKCLHSNTFVSLYWQFVLSSEESSNKVRMETQTMVMKTNYFFTNIFKIRQDLYHSIEHAKICFNECYDITCVDLAITSRINCCPLHSIFLIDHRWNHFSSNWSCHILLESSLKELFDYINYALYLEP